MGALTGVRGWKRREFIPEAALDGKFFHPFGCRLPRAAVRFLYSRRMAGESTALAEFVLGVHSGTLRLEGLEALQAHSCHMAEQCRRRLLIYSNRLNPHLYNTGCFIEAVRQLVIRHPSTQVEILVADTTALVKGGHRLPRLAQDLPSSITIRRRNEEYESDMRSFLLADEAGYLLRNLWHDMNSVRGDYAARPVVRNLADEFQRIWDRSEADPGLRRLNL